MCSHNSRKSEPIPEVIKKNYLSLLYIMCDIIMQTNNGFYNDDKYNTRKYSN